MIDRRLYLPEHSWCSDPERRLAAGIPEGIQFATKPQLAGEMITGALDAGITASWVTGDEAYGQDPRLRAALEARGVGYVMAVACSMRVMINHGRTAVRADIIAGRLPPRPGNGTVPAMVRRGRGTTTGPGSIPAPAATATCSSAAEALELAGASEDHLTYCTTLRGMSVQAVDLGHGRQAMRLADAAAAASPQAGPRMRAFLAGQQAHAAAQIGERDRALAHLREAEVAMDKAASREKAFGSYDPSSLNYHTSQVRYELGDVRGAVEAMQRSDNLRHDVYRRTRVKERALLAERQFAVGHLEAACATWHRALDDYPLVQSGRADQRMTAMFGLIQPHLKNQAARELHERARAVVPASLLG
ncbi:transposase [Streptomyces sp. NPDC019937]|uniref:transposase n=1 Tax=Streptomyces sp. NPDC019937 TaxID=3154787 RepID=UPI00340544E2